MHIASIRVKNFRGLKDVEIPLSRSTVLIGENNSGKSSVLDCISLALGRRWGRRGTGFSEYDLSMDGGSAGNDRIRSTDSGSQESLVGGDKSSLSADPEVDGVEETSIELFFTEQTGEEWPEEITSGLFGIIQTDPLTGLNSITLRVTYKLNFLERDYDSGWAFLDINGDPIGSKEARRATNTQKFFKFVPVFFLSALRDASEEFSSRSQFWGSLLKAVEIPPDELQLLDTAVEELNARLLAADPRVAETVERLKEIQTVVANGAAEDVSIRALPMKVWELLARSEVVIKGESDAPWLPLRRHGQGVKSLSVIYLFDAFIGRLLKERFTEHSEPIVALEEPEVHLHPQAVRALWPQIDALPGQKIVATHSPYFIQYVPIRDIRLLRRGANGVRAHLVRDSVSVDLPANDELLAVADQRKGQLSYDLERGLLHASRPVGEDLCRKLLKCFPGTACRQQHSAIRRLQRCSNALMEAEDLDELEDWARRFRGEIFFSRFWILCEGQSEVFLLTALFEALALPLDVRSVSLIDYQNNGSARAFACLARAFEFPWALLADGDGQGRNTLASLRSAGFSEEELAARTVQLPNDTDLEDHVVSSAWRPLALAVAKDSDSSMAEKVDDAVLAKTLRAQKPLWARRLGEKLLRVPPTVESLPDALGRLREILLEHEWSCPVFVDGSCLGNQAASA